MLRDIPTLPPPQTNGDNLRLLFDQTYYAANPAPAFVRDGAYSAVARLKNLWGGGKDSYLRDEIREEGDSIYKLFAWKTAPRENGDVLIRTTGIKCGASRKNAYRCITYNSWMPPGTDAEGAAELERIYDLLAEYPLSHNEELLSDMARRRGSFRVFILKKEKKIMLIKLNNAENGSELYINPLSVKYVYKTMDEDNTVIHFIDDGDDYLIVSESLEKVVGDIDGALSRLHGVPK